MKKDFKSDFAEITEMTNKLRSHTLKESIEYADQYDDEDGFVDDATAQEGAEAQEYVAPEKAPQDDAEDAVSQIRELCLRGMVARAKNNMDPLYQKLRQILQYCDKADKTEEEK